MIHDQNTLALIEAAQAATPWCAACGQPTTVVDRDGELWLECLTLTEDRAPLAAALHAIAPHEHSRLLSAEEATTIAA